MTFLPKPDGRYRSVRRITQPAVEPVSLADAKTHLRVDSSDDDAYISALVSAAREWVEEYLDRSLIYTQWQAKADTWLIEFELPRPPIATGGTFTAVTLTYESTDGTTKTVDSAEYRVDRDSTPAVVRNLYEGVWPGDVKYDANAVTITYWAGYGADGTSVPQAIKHAMLMLLGYWYERRMAVDTVSGQEMPLGARALLDSVRWGDYR